MHADSVANEPTIFLSQIAGLSFATTMGSVFTAAKLATRFVED